MRRRVAPPRRIEAPAPRAVVAGACPHAQLRFAEADVNVALEILAIHRRVGGKLHRDFQPFHLHGIDFAQRKAVFHLAGFKPEQLGRQPVRMIKRARGIAFADPRVFGDKAAFRADIPARWHSWPQRELERQRAHALLRFRNKVHADRIDAPGAELHRSANAG